MSEQDDGVLPFAGTTGQGIRIAVIDSGVNPRHPHINGLAGGVVVIDEGIFAGDDAHLDRLGHGTAVMGAIQEKAPAAQYYAVRVFLGELRTKASLLVRAIEWCIAEKMDVVNLSLGTVNAAHAAPFAEVAARARQQGVLLTAAREANGELCYPGSLPDVINVGLDWECPRNQYHVDNSGAAPIFYASGYPRTAPGVPRTRNLNGISFAVANMSGLVARACEAIESRNVEAGLRVERVCEALLAGAP